MTNRVARPKQEAINQTAVMDRLARLTTLTLASRHGGSEAYAALRSEACGYSTPAAMRAAGERTTAEGIAWVRRERAKRVTHGR